MNVLIINFLASGAPISFNESIISIFDNCRYIYRFKTTRFTFCLGENLVLFQVINN